MGRHLENHPDFNPELGKSYFKSIHDAENVLQAYHDGNVRNLNIVDNNTVEFEYDRAKGYFRNKSMIENGRPAEVTHKFRIEGTNQAKVIPLNPQ